MQGGTIEGALTAKLIDELPVLAVLGTQTEEGLRIRDAAELRLKESDRIGALAENLRRLGASVQEYPDGLEVAGRQKLHGAVVDSFGDLFTGLTAGGDRDDRCRTPGAVLRDGAAGQMRLVVGMAKDPHQTSL